MYGATTTVYLFHLLIRKQTNVKWSCRSIKFPILKTSRKVIISLLIQKINSFQVDC